MDRMDIFSDTVNESFGYDELEWEGNEYMLDFSKEDSVLNFLKIVTGQVTLNSAFYVLSLIQNKVPALDRIIDSISNDTLAQTSYRKFQEFDCDKKWVLYNTNQYNVGPRDVMLHYIVNDPRPEQPINASSIESMFAECTAESLDLSHWDTSKIRRMHAAFSGLANLKSINLTNWDTSNTYDMGMMFYNNKSLASIDVSNWDTRNVTRMGMMFEGCVSLTSLDLSNWDTSGVIITGSMFENCTSLTHLDVSKWNTGCVEYMNDMFLHCESLKTLDIANWSTGEVTNMQNMFQACYSLESLDLHAWDVSKVENANAMFAKCKKLKSLDLSGWKIDKLYNTVSMFANCTSLEDLDLSQWSELFRGSPKAMSFYNNSKTTMFLNCKSLVTTYNSIYDEFLKNAQ